MDSDPVTEKVNTLVYCIVSARIRAHVAEGGDPLNMPLSEWIEDGIKVAVKAMEEIAQRAREVLNEADEE